MRTVPDRMREVDGDHGGSHKGPHAVPHHQEGLLQLSRASETFGSLKLGR